MHDTDTTTRISTSRWPHRLAVVLVCATFPLIWIGALVTTEDAGMAVPDWPNTYGYNMFLYPIGTWLGGPWDLFIEHGHRLFASGVGMLTIALLAAVLFFDSRRWLRWLTVGALVMVCAQGALGGMRVLFDEVTLAKLHGCVGPLFFAVCVALACFTSRWWRDSESGKRVAGTGAFQVGAVVVTLLAYVQLVLGAQLRHVAPSAGFAGFQAAVWGHVIMAFVIAGYSYLLAFQAVRKLRDMPALCRPAVALALLVTIQIALGATSWVVKYSVPGPLQTDWTANWINTAGSMTASVIITSHVAIGSLILVTGLLIAIRSFRMLERPATNFAAQQGAMEAAV